MSTWVMPALDPVGDLAEELGQGRLHSACEADQPGESGVPPSALHVVERGQVHLPARGGGRLRQAEGAPAGADDLTEGSELTIRPSHAQRNRSGQRFVTAR